MIIFSLLARLEGIKYTSDLNKYTDKALYNLRSLL